VTTTPAAPPAALAAEAQALLGRLVGDPTAQFRDGQLESVTLISPVPDATLTRLEPGTLIIRLIICCL